MKRLFIIALSLVGMATTSAKDKIEATIGADLVSQYIWRGQNLGDFSLQPTLGVGYKGLSLSAWGSVGISNSSDTKELDLILKYEHKGFSVGVTDYWFSEGTYFQYHAHKTTHIWEGFVRLRLPLRYMVHEFCWQRRPERQRQASLQQLLRAVGTFPSGEARLEGNRRHRALAHHDLWHQRLCLHQRFASCHEELPHQAEVSPARLCRPDLQSLFGQVLFRLRSRLLAEYRRMIIQLKACLPKL